MSWRCLDIVLLLCPFQSMLRQCRDIKVTSLKLSIRCPNIALLVSDIALMFYVLMLVSRQCRNGVVTLKNYDISISTYFVAMSQHWSNWHDTLHTMSRHCSSSVATLLLLIPFLLFLLLFCFFFSNFYKT